jgi:GPCR-chaperone
MFRALEALPDFKLDMHFEVLSSFIPFLNQLTPNDTYKIYKRGSSLRLDMTLVGFKNLKSVRGNLSVLFKGRGCPNEGDLIVVDHDTRAVSSIFDNVVSAKLDKDLEDIMSDTQFQKMYKADKFQIEPVFDRNGQPVSKRIEGY